MKATDIIRIAGGLRLVNNVPYLSCTGVLSYIK